MKKLRVLILIVCYHAENFIEGVIKRIPDNIWCNDRYDVEVMIIDDESTDRTFYKAQEYANQNRHLNITVLYNPKNLGYGGNQKIGYTYAIDNKYDVLVLLHGDGQYAPEYLEKMLQPILDGEADVVLGSRMIHKKEALKGKMPLYKWIGNQILTFMQNHILGSNLSEFHTGYRAYSIAALTSIPYDKNSDYFDFDTDILIQLIDTNKRIKEIPIPTYYGDEISRVNGLRYAVLILLSTIRSRIQKLGIFYDARFDYELDRTYYPLKLGYKSSHQYALDRIESNSTVLDIGCGPGLMAYEIAKKQVKLVSIDRDIRSLTKQYSYKTIQADVEEYDFESDSTRVDLILALDIIEHLMSPESFLAKLRERYCQDAPRIIITTVNTAFILIRIALLFGQLNYGRRGILDLTHTRLFTFSSFRNILKNSGYEILTEEGIPAPYPLAFGNNWLSRLLVNINNVLIYFSKDIFSYQVAVVVKPKPTLRLLLKNSYKTSEMKRKMLDL
ncbi:MAG: bifunctional glycosyltransferase/class I SAM-dependent methyltransferase [Syntrophales bacterium]|jgi:glycosyltransferase involved in cell wall biosynthesis